MADDDDISRRYRELPREEPPRHLDDAILAAARRAVHTRPAPLVVPSGRQRWYFPLAAAAIIVLAVAVTVHVERERPSEEFVSTPSAPAAAAPAAPAVEPSAREMTRNETAAQPEKPKPERRRKAESDDSRQLRDQAAVAPPPELQKAPEPAPPSAVPPPAPTQDAVGSIAQSSGMIAESTQAPTPAPAPAPAPRAKPGERVKAATSAERRFDEGARAASSLSAFALQSPEQWLQGIADLRKQGRHEEADRELAEFRKRHPDYRIPPTMRERVERR